MSLSAQSIFNKRTQAGFTMLEMIVVVAIVLMISAIVIAYIPQFRDRSSLDLVAQEIAITIRSAQAFASGGRTSPFENREFIVGVPSYGVNFDLTNPNQIILFADLDNNDELHSSRDERNPNYEIMETYELRGINITDILDGNEEDLRKDIVNIMYTRPNLQAEFYDESGSKIEDKSEVNVIITGGRGEGNSKMITTHFNGQIAVSNYE